MNGNEKNMNMTVGDLVEFIRDYSFNDFARIIISCEEKNPDAPLLITDFEYNYHKLLENEEFAEYANKEMLSFAVYPNDYKDNDLYELWIDIAM